jgi:hypothetical protein
LTGWTQPSFERDDLKLDESSRIGVNNSPNPLVLVLADLDMAN